MKIKVYKKEIKSRAVVLCVPYCGLQFALKHESPFAYSTRAEGWACDYYNVEGVVISTGYDPTGKKVSYELIKKYETEAKKLDSVLSFEEKAAKNREILKRFVSEALED